MAWAITPPIVRTVGRLAWRLEYDIDPGLPDPPFVVSSNHHSFLDAFLIGTGLNQKIRFLALEDLFGNYRWVDFALKAYDVIRVKRGVVPLGPVRTAINHLAGGGAVGLFPEGTRHQEFDPDRARPGAAWLAARTAVPLIPVAIAGSERVLGVDNRLHMGRIRVTVGPSLHATGTGRSGVDDLTTRWGVWVGNTLKRT